MAIRYAVASGNWSDTATWDGGTLPASTDDVYANNFTVNIDQSVTVNSLKRIANGSPSIAAGGQFIITAAATVTITAGIAAADNATNSSYLLGVNAGAGTVVINSNVTAGAGSLRVGIQISGGTGTITINGNLQAGNAAGADALSVTSTGPTVVVNGSVTGSTANVVSFGARMSVAGKLEVNGAVRGGSAGSQAYGVNVTAGALTVHGTLTSGDGASSAGVVAVNAVGATALRISGHIYSGGMSPSTGPNGFWPINGPWSVIDDEDIFIHVYNDDNYPSGNNGTQTVLTRYGTSNPATEDVREGVIYGIDGQLTGTLAVPPAASVAAGVPTDNTVGTAAVKLSDVLAGTGAQIAAATSA